MSAKKLFYVTAYYNADLFQDTSPDIKFVNLARQYGGHCLGSGSGIGERELKFGFTLEIMAVRFKDDVLKLRQKLENEVIK